MRILVFGDVVGSAGRAAISRALPMLREQHQPDSVIINIENIAHGIGIAPEPWAEAATWKADAYTTGDHAWDNKAGVALLEDVRLPIVRPANYPDGVPGRGFITYAIGAFRVAVINLQGQVFFRNQPLNPFHTLDRVLQQPPVRDAAIVLVDFHAEASSEKRGMGWYADGRIAGMWGTHTHVPTADAQVLPKGTGYLTDVGMNGAHHSIIGMAPPGPLKRFLTQTPADFEPATDGPLEVNAVLFDLDPMASRAVAVQSIRHVLPAE